MNIIFLSYDGNDERIIQNNNKLNNHSEILANIPKIFIKKRKKHHIIAYFSAILKKKFGTEREIMFVDDNHANIADANKFKSTLQKLTNVHYTAHVAKKHQDLIGVTNIKNILDSFL